MSVRLFVGNLSPDTTADELRQLFGEIGNVESCLLSTNESSGRSKGFGFVVMTSEEAADTATATLHGRDLHGQALRVKLRGELRNMAGYIGPPQP